MAIDFKQKLEIDENFLKIKQKIFKSIDDSLLAFTDNVVFKDITSSKKYTALIKEISNYVDYAKAKYIKRLNTRYKRN